MVDTVELLIGRTRSFLEHLRSGRAQAGDLEALLLDRERILNQVQDTPADIRMSQARFDELRELDDELHLWCEQAQKALAHRLSHVRRRITQSNASGQLVLESA